MFLLSSYWGICKKKTFLHICLDEPIQDIVLYNLYSFGMNAISHEFILSSFTLWIPSV